MPRLESNKPPRALCRGCRYYYITWEPEHPYGCRAMGFKSRRPPYLEVMRSTPGIVCLHYHPRS